MKISLWFTQIFASDKWAATTSDRWAAPTLSGSQLVIFMFWMIDKRGKNFLKHFDKFFLTDIRNLKAPNSKHSFFYGSTTTDFAKWTPEKKMATLDFLARSTMTLQGNSFLIIRFYWCFLFWNQAYCWKVMATPILVIFGLFDVLLKTRNF